MVHFLNNNLSPYYPAPPWIALFANLASKSKSRSWWWLINPCIAWDCFIRGTTSSQSYLHVPSGPARRVYSMSHQPGIVIWRAQEDSFFCCASPSLEHYLPEVRLAQLSILVARLWKHGFVNSHGDPRVWHSCAVDVLIGTNGYYLSQLWFFCRVIWLLYGFIFFCF